MDKVTDLIRQGKVREISDMRDESGLEGLKIAIDLKRGVDPQKLMAKLMKMTPLMDTFGCNFNVLIGGTPQVLGVRALIDEWIAFRAECLKRRTFFSLGKARERLHLLLGLKKILLDIDKAVSIVRETEREEEVVPNLMIGFGVDEIQAEYIANIRLRYLNQEYILNRLSDIDALEKEIADLEGILKNKNRIYQLIKNDLKRVKKQYPAPRRTELVYEDQLEEIDETDHIEDYAVTYFLSRGGYFKKITPQSLRMNSAQKYKDGDALNAQIEAGNKAELIFFTSAQNAYKARGYDFEDAKASLMGDYLPAKLEMEADETVVAMAVTGDYSGDMVFFFENGKAARVPLAAYKTVTNRRRLVNAFSNKSPLVAAFQLPAESDFVLISSNQKALIISSALIPQKATKSTLGVTVMTQKGKNRLERVTPLEGAGILHVSYYRTKNIPAVGHLLRQQDLENGQSTLP